VNLERGKVEVSEDGNRDQRREALRKEFANEFQRTTEIASSWSTTFITQGQLEHIALPSVAPRCRRFCLPRKAPSASDIDSKNGSQSISRDSCTSNGWNKSKGWTKWHANLTAKS
jgi:hypothetical protein